MKNHTTLACIALLTCTVHFGFAQHNDNQRSFKSSSSNAYRIQLGEFEHDKIYNTQTYAQQQVSGLRYYTKDNEMLFEVRSLFNARADRFLVVFNLTQIGKTAVETDDLLNTRINGFTAGLEQMGIKGGQVYIDMIYLIPTFEFEMEKKLFSKTYNEVPTGFEMQKNIHIAFDDINIVDELVTLAAKNEIYDLVKLDFFVKNAQAMYDTLREQSVDYLNKKLASFKKLNSNLTDEYHIVRESSRAIYPETQYSNYDAFVTQSIEAVKNKTITKIRKPKTVAYDQIPYNEFDIIINPDILQPVVQYVYTLQVKYTLPEPEKKKGTYMLITPNGDLRQVPVE
ncbi:MAG: hypothetical protein COA57_04415 [Flavobacteriales bacterium]|nr:MAG: hypothetical protein COA57_04415 [Flavobacteriales bacterium]